MTVMIFDCIQFKNAVAWALLGDFWYLTYVADCHHVT